MPRAAADLLPLTTSLPNLLGYRFSDASQIESAGLGVTYAATAKINATAGVRYGRTTLVNQLGGETLDISLT